MSPTNKAALLICADTARAHQLLEAMLRRGLDVPLPIAAGLAQARGHIRRISPGVILLDPAVLGARALEPAVRELARTAPVIILSVGTPSDACRLQDLVVARKVEFLPPGQSAFAPGVAALLARRFDSGNEPSPSGLLRLLDSDAVPDDFGEILRHEINNPLTGILGNAELLLARRDLLPQAAVYRLETIAELAVRLRETIRRLSNALEGRTQQARSV